MAPHRGILRQLDDALAPGDALVTLERTSLKVDAASLLWERSQRAAGYETVGSMSIDASVQGGWDYLVCRSDELQKGGSDGVSTYEDETPNSMWNKDLIPLGCLGLGAADISHKLRVLVHHAKLKTGSDRALENWRWTRIGLVTDQGTERLLADSPNILGIQDVEQVLTEYRAGRLELLPSKPENWLFPRLVGVTGPLHIAWNAYETAVKGSAKWDEHETFLRSVLYFLGTKATNQIFLDKCVPELAERRLFRGWKHHVIDWKWEYMEEAYQKLVKAIDCFFRRFDAKKFLENDGEDS